MRSLLFFVAVSASAGCSWQMLYTTTDYMQRAVLDDDAMYVSFFFSDGSVKRVDLNSGEATTVSMGSAGPWSVRHGLFVTSATIGRSAQDVKELQLHDGSVYWLDTTDALRRTMLGGGATDTISEEVSQFAVVEDRVVFMRGGDLFYKRLTDREATFLLRDVDSLDSVTSDGILVTRYTPGVELYRVHGEVLRVSWSGEVQSIYETDANTYHNVFSLGGALAGATAYVEVVNNYDTQLLRLRDGFPAEVYHALVTDILAADSSSVTFLEYGGHGADTGWHHLVRVSCASSPRMRAVR